MVHLRFWRGNDSYLGIMNFVSVSINNAGFETFANIVAGDVDTAWSSTTETAVQIAFPDSASFSGLTYRCFNNTQDGILVITLRINAVNGNCSLTVPALSGAVVLQDTTNRDGISPLDELSTGIDQTLSTLGTQGRVAIFYRVSRWLFVSS